MKKHKPEIALAPHIWSPAALMAKAQRFAEAMQSMKQHDWSFGLWSTFVLESLGRATLASVNPTLLAETKNSWNQIYFALGHSPNAPKFRPHSIDVKAVFERIGEIFAMDPALVGFVNEHMARRNEDLHSGGTPFDVSNAGWLGPFYETCRFLLHQMDQDLDLLFGEEGAVTAEAVITASKDTSAKAIKKSVASHHTKWESLSSSEKSARRAQADVWATRQEGHRATCPACTSTALLTGTPTAPAVRTLEPDGVVESQPQLASRFECVACGLKIVGLAQLAAAELTQTFTSTKTYDLAEYYGTGEPEWEPDFNEM